jgi:PAS domain S-box-containing protein
MHDPAESLMNSCVLPAIVGLSALSGVLVLDRRGVIITMNESWPSPWREQESWARDVVAPGVSFLDACAAAAWVGAADAAAALEGVTSVCNGRRSDFTLEYRSDVTGDERWGLMTVTALRHENGGAVVALADITERKRAEAAMRQGEEPSRQLADALPVGIWMSGADGARTYANRTWFDLIGWPPDQALDLRWREGIHPNDLERCMEVYRHAVASRESFSVEYRMRRRDGQYRRWLDNGAPRYEAGGGFLGYIGAVTDLTDCRSVRKATRGLGGLLIEAQEEERARIGRELHDNVSQRLALLSIDIDKLWEALPDGADEMAAGIARLRAASRDVAREVHDLSHRLHSVKLEALGLVPAVRGHCREVSQHSIQVQFRDANVPNTLRDDAALCVFRIVQEALANVVKHSGAAEARVMLSGGDGEIVLRVEDGGCGFEPDTRCDGIGLMSMRERVQLVGGDITVRSTPNQGTVIEARVPVHGSPIQAGRSLPTA